LPLDPMELPDELRLTQYGERPPHGDGFRDRLRESIGETELSVILGEVDSNTAHGCGSRPPITGPFSHSGDRFRQAENGLVLKRTAFPSNPNCFQRTVKPFRSRWQRARISRESGQ
jgi:hypothetical protein